MAELSPLFRAAREIMRLDYPEEVLPDGTLTEVGEIYWVRKGYWYTHAARAVLVAIYEPTEDAIAAANASLDDEQDCLWAPIRPIWQAMLSVAMEGTPPSKHPDDIHFPESWAKARGA